MTTQVLSLENGLLTNLTCSLCLNVYTTPKLMSSCPRSFCLECVKLIKPESPLPSITNYTEIKCPECRKPCSFKKATDLQTNFGRLVFGNLKLSSSAVDVGCRFQSPKLAADSPDTSGVLLSPTTDSSKRIQQPTDSAAADSVDGTDGHHEDKEDEEQPASMNSETAASASFSGNNYGNLSDSQASEDDSRPLSSDDGTPSSQENDFTDLGRLVMCTALPLRKIDTLKLDDVKKIVPVPSKNWFLVLHGDKQQITILAVSDVIKELRSYLIEIPSVTALTVDDVASDDRNTVFLTASYINSEGTQRRGIFRFWTTNCNANVKALCYEASSNRQDYSGMVIAKEMGFVFTTKDNGIIALSSINTVRHDCPKTIWSCDIGPNPYVHGVRELSPTLLHLVCSTDNKLVDLTLKRETSWSEVLKVVNKKLVAECFGETVPNLDVVIPNLIGLWNRKAIVSSGCWLRKYDNFPEDPVFTGNLYPPQSENALGFRCKALAVMSVINDETKQSRDVVALLPSGKSDQIIFMTIPETGGLDLLL